MPEGLIRTYDQNGSTYVSPTTQNTPAQHTLHFSMPAVPNIVEKGEEVEEIGGEQEQSAQVVADAWADAGRARRTRPADTEWTYRQELRLYQKPPR